MTAMSPDLIAFLKAWYDWATNGAPNNDPFWRWCGLCTNCDDTHPDAFDELTDMLGDDYPFDAADYRIRQRAETMHECPKRLAWVRERLIEAGELRNCDDCDFSTTAPYVTVCPDLACRGTVG